MKKLIVFSALVLSSALAWSQGNNPAPDPTTPQTPPPQTTTPQATTPQQVLNQNGQGQLTFTNRSGQVYSAEQLSSQIQQLSALVEQTLPMITAFNEDFGSGANSSLGGRLGSILGGLLNRTNSAAAQSSLATTNAIAVLSSLLNTNAPGTAVYNPNLLSQLNTLQRDLQPVRSTLQEMHSTGSASGSPPQVISSGPANRTNQYANPNTPPPATPNPTPTGR